MRALLHSIVRGQWLSALMLALASAIPLLVWLAAAGGSLLLLRRGFAAGKNVLLLALLPALIWWLAGGEPRLLLILLGSFALAQVLRRSESWLWVLLASLPLGIAFALFLQWSLGEPLAALNAQLQQLLPQMLGPLYQQMGTQEQLQFMALMPPLLLGVLSALLLAASLLCLMLARYWQALLFNPGGFAREFHALRLPGRIALPLLALMLLAPGLAAPLALLMPLCSIPLLFAGIALLHGKLAGKRMGRFWLVVFYLCVLIFMQLAYPFLVVLALCDSLFDFRGLRQRPSQGDRPQ